MAISRGTIRGFSAVVIAFLIIALIDVVRPNSTRSADFDCSQMQSTTANIDIAEGESGSDIAQELFDKGVTASFSSFFGIAVSDGRSQRIAPGVHRVNQGLCAKQALEQLLDSSRITNLLSINEGAWISEIKESLVGIGYSKSEIEGAFLGAKIPSDFTTLEGLIFPAQYSFESSTPVSSILHKSILRAESEMKRAGFFIKDSEFTPAQSLIIASLIQAEGDVEDFAKISRVVRNRLSIGMPLQFDSTVHYIKKSRGSVFLSTASTLISSPYNTYKRYGLPPGPINNPGFAAMNAATHPAEGDWLYFITVEPGDTRFTRTIEEFNEWKVLYKKNFRAGKFRSGK